MIDKHCSGLYYIKGTDIDTQLIVTKDLPDEEAEYLKLLQSDYRNYELFSKWLLEYLKNMKNPLYSVIMDAIAKGNPNMLMDVYNNMGIANLNENNKAFLMDIVKKFELDKVLKEEGKKEDARNLLKLGVSSEIIIKATGLSEKDIMEIKKDLDNR